LLGRLSQIDEEVSETLQLVLIEAGFDPLRRQRGCDESTFGEDVIGIRGNGETYHEVSAEQRVDGQLHQNLVGKHPMPTKNVFKEFERTPKLPA